MYKLLFMAKNNAKKQKGDMITFVILTFISAFLMVNCFTVLTGLGKVLDTNFEKMNGAHILFWVGNSVSETGAAEKAFKENRYITEYEVTPKAHMHVEYRNANEKDFSSFEFMAEAFEENPSVMKVEKPDNLQKNDILLPFNLKSRFNIGDTMQIRIGGKIFDMNVAGFVEDPYFCSTLNISMHSIYLSEEMINTLCDEPKGAIHGSFYKGIADTGLLKENGLTTIELEGEIGDGYKKHIAEYGPDRDESGVGYILLNWDMMKNGTKILPNIVMAVIAVFSILILLIGLIIISFSIRNFIQKNMKNTGILEASGYTVSQLRWALTLQITMTAVIGALLGIVLAVLVFDISGDIYSKVVGLRWNQPINPIVLAEAFLALVSLVFIVARLVSRRYKKITVLDALRGGIITHSHKKNLFTFDKTPLPVSVVLSLKETFGGIGKTIVMSFMIMILSVVTMIGFGMKVNFGGNPDGLIKLMAFEMSTMVVTGDDNILEDLRTNEKVESVFAQAALEPNLTFNGRTAMHKAYAVDDMKYTQNTNIIEGRMQKTDNEIMVTAAIAEDFGIKIGDVVELENAEIKAEYLVVGINQRMEQYGRTIYMTTEGLKRIMNSDIHYNYYVNAKPGVSYDDLKAELEKLEAEKNIELESVELEKYMGDTIDTLTMTMQLICGVIVVITILIVIFVESLIIRAKLGREWRGMGISKALGETSFGLISQIMLSNIPAVLIGGILGAFISEFVGKVGCRVIFSTFGIKKISFDIPVAYMILTVLGIALVAVLASALAGLKVRKLNPIELITEE